MNEPRKVNLEPVISRLTTEFDGVFSAETIRRHVTESAAPAFADARITAHVPMFVERYARDVLRARAHNEGSIMKETPVVLFVCVHNAGRSQMAAGLLDHEANGRVDVRSAGSTPADEINPVVVEAMAEVGVDISKEFPKPLSDEVVLDADVVVTMGCGDACPVYPGKKYLDWDLTDPSGKGIEEVRTIRDEIDRRIQSLLEELLADDVGVG